MTISVYYRLLLLAVASFTTLSPVLAVDWVARHGLTGSEYQVEFDKWSDQGLSLRCVAGYNDATNGGTVRYAAIWDNTNHPPNRAHHGMTKTEFNTKSATYFDEGYRLKFINMYTFGSEVRYAGTWELSSKLEQHLLGLTWSGFESVHTSLSGLGYQLESMSSCNLIAGASSQDLYSGVWVKSAPEDHTQESRFQLTPSQYQAEFNNLAGQGYRLICLAPCTVDGELRYNGIWRKPFGSFWWSYSNLEEADYAAESENALYQRWRTEYVSVHMLNGKPRFNVVWTDNGGMPYDCIKILDDDIEQYRENNDIPGIAIAIMKDGRLVFAKGYGESDHVTGRRAAPLDRYRIASVSKAITAAAILQLTEDTDLNLDDLVFGAGDTALGTQYGNVRYSPWEKQITVRHLLHHSSGWTTDGPLWWNDYAQDHDAIMDWSVDSNEPTTQPGTARLYNNLGYHALGRIIEQYSGQTYEDYCRDNLLAQCGITTMELGKQTLEDRKERDVRYYDPQFNPYGIIDPERMDANGGWIATPIDLLRFLRCIDDRPFPSDILNSNSRSAMRNAPIQGETYGLGWDWQLNKSWEGHNGGMTGSSSFLVNRTDGVAYAFTTNKYSVNNDSTWNLKNVIDSIINQINNKNTWPTHDLFPFTSGYREWITLNFSEALSTSNDIGFFDRVRPEGDPDGDSLVNSVEKYFGTDPNAADLEPLTIQRDGDEVVLRWPNPQDSGYTAKVLLSDDFKSWEEGNYAAVRSVNNAGAPIDFMETHIPINHSNKIYAKLQIGED
jgi:CubicO group peptidase (beta-lactamase class C family)